MMTTGMPIRAVTVLIGSARVFGNEVADQQQGGAREH